MTLQSSGAISIQNITTELGQGQLTFGLNDANGRILAGVPSGTISLSNFYGKGVGHGSTLFNTVGAFSFTVPPLIYQLSVRIRGGGGGGGRGVNNGSDVFAAGAGGSGYLTEVVINVFPGQVITGSVGLGGLGNSGNGDAGGSSSFDIYVSSGGNGGLAAASGSYVSRAGGTGAFNGTAGYSSYSAYYLGGCGAGTGNNGYIVVANSSACKASKGGDSLYGGYIGGSEGYTYSSTFGAYYGAGGGGAGDLGNGADGGNGSGGAGGAGGNGGGGGGGSCGNGVGGNGGNGYVLVTY